MNLVTIIGLKQFMRNKSCYEKPFMSTWIIQLKIESVSSKFECKNHKKTRFFIGTEEVKQFWQLC